MVQDLKANESRLRDINKVASELESEGLMAEEAPMVQAQVTSGSLSLLYEPSFILELSFNGDHVFFSIFSNKSCSVLLLARLESFLQFTHILLDI